MSDNAKLLAVACGEDYSKGGAGAVSGQANQVKIMIRKLN